MELVPVKEFGKQSNMPKSFTSEFPPNHPVCNTSYAPAPSSVNNQHLYSPVATDTNHPPFTSEPVLPALNLPGTIEIIKTTGNITDKLAGAATGLSMEASQKNIRLVSEEKGFEQIFQNPTAAGNVQQACFVHLKEQYHLNNELLSQPKAGKFFVKVRTEIGPGRYMANLELHSSR